MEAIPIPAADEAEFTMETRSVSPAHFLIRIESLSLFPKSGIRKVESREFAAGDYKWKLVIYPDGHDAEDNHVSVYLAMSDTSSLPMGWDVYAMFNIFLYNQILDNYLCFQGQKVRRFSVMKSIWGFSKLISKKSMMEPSSGFLVDDNCVFGAEVFVIKCQQVIECFSLKDKFPEKHIWKIPKFSKLGGICSSEEFTADGCKWKVILYPTGFGIGEGQFVSVFLRGVDFSPHKKVKADFSICIKNQLSDDQISNHSIHWFKEAPDTWGWPWFIPISFMKDSKKGLVVDDCCIIETEVSVQATA